MIRSEKTRQFIIEKTAPIFNKKGYSGTYISDLTDATGLTKGSIYGNFENKNEVALEAFKHNYGQLKKAISKRMNKADRSWEKLTAFLDYYIDEYQTIFNKGGCAILNTAVDSDDGNELLREAVKKSISDWKHKIESILEKGISKEELQQMDVSRFANKMIGLIEGSIMLAKTMNKPNILVENIEELKNEINELRLT